MAHHGSLANHNGMHVVHENASVGSDAREHSLLFRIHSSCLFIL
jgi:hypothetical protein